MAGRINSIREALAACFSANQEPLTKVEVVTWINSNYPENDFNAIMLERQLYRSCRNIPSAYKSTAPKIILYDKSKKSYQAVPPDYQDPIVPFAPNAPTQEASEFSASTQFVLEAHLRDYLSQNLFLLEKGLVLWSTNPASIEYWVGKRRIDILAKDQSGVPVVVELKVSKGHEQTLGQALYYRGKLKQMLSLSRVRIILVASEITEELRVTSTEVGDVDVFSYKLTMQVQKIELTNSEQEQR